MHPLLRRHGVSLAVFAAALVALAATAGPRLPRRSPDPHFVVQAAAWLRGRAAIER